MRFPSRRGRPWRAGTRTTASGSAPLRRRHVRALDRRPRARRPVLERRHVLLREHGRALPAAARLRDLLEEGARELHGREREGGSVSQRGLHPSAGYIARAPQGPSTGSCARRGGTAAPTAVACSACRERRSCVDGNDVRRRRVVRTHLLCTRMTPHRLSAKIMIP